MSKFDSNHLLSDSFSATPSVPSDSTYPADLDWGVDRLTFGFDVNPNYGDFLSPMWTVLGTGKPPELPDAGHTLLMNLPFMQTTVQVRYFPLILRCYIEFNPSTALYGKSAQLAPAGTCIPLADNLLNELMPYVHAEFDLVNDLGEVVRANGWEKAIKLSRLDVARNFYLDDPAPVKAAIQAQRPKSMKRKMTYENGKSGWGIENGTKGEGKDTFYDKEQELQTHNVKLDPNPSGTVFRFETQLRRTRLKKNGFHTLADINETRVWQAIEARWEASRWGVELPEPGTIKQALEGLKATEKESILGYLNMHQLGLESEYNPSRHRVMKARLRTLGINPRLPIDAQGQGARRLDLFAGTIVECD